MEKQENKQERSFELRSEKVCSIVGQIPSSLVRYGITAIGAVLLCLLAVAYFLPYKQVYSGTATVHRATTVIPADSTDITILLKFENKHPYNVNGQEVSVSAMLVYTVKKNIAQVFILERYFFVSICPAAGPGTCLAVF